MIGSQTFPTVDAYPYAVARATVRNGDILMVSGNSLDSRIIRTVTRSVWSHVGLLWRVRDINRIFVLESVGHFGVRALPLSHYAGDWEGTGQPYDGRILVARHDSFQELATPMSLNALSTFATDKFGLPYDDGEIAHIPELLIAHALGHEMSALDLDRTKYICSEYVAACLAKIGIQITSGASCSCILPSDYSLDDNIRPVCEIKTNVKEG